MSAPLSGFFFSNWIIDYIKSYGCCGSRFCLTSPFVQSKMESNAAEMCHVTDTFLELHASDFVFPLNGKFLGHIQNPLSILPDCMDQENRKIL